LIIDGTRGVKIGHLKLSSHLKLARYRTS